jgi:hypothetical protein
MPKTLHDLVRPENPPEGDIPHVFHRHGPVTHYQKSHFGLPDGNHLPVVTGSQKMTAYGVIAAGDAMIPWPSAEVKTAAGPMLQFSLRMALSTQLMLDAGGHEEPPAFPPSEAPDSVYGAATNALAHHGTANGAKILARSRKFIRESGSLPQQARMLGKYIEAMVEAALDHDYAGLEWLYKEFHAKYGTENRPNPNPGPPEKPPDRPKPEPGWGASIADGMGAVPDGKSNPGIAWGTIEAIERVPMERWKHPTIRSEKHWKYSEFGVFKYPWRALPTSDYRCFSIQRRKYGGTVLIDMSGSMSIKQSHIDQLLDIAPYATVAGYGAHHQDRGKIVIMAENAQKGSASDAREKVGQYNIIDGPALRWLATQQAPRIWVSDGHVTGVNECQHPVLNADCAQVSRSARITRIHSLPVMLKAIGATVEKGDDDE